MYGLAGKFIQGLAQGARRIIPQRRFAPASLIDTATSPKTYQGLAQRASDTLGRTLPPQFRGAGFQNVPTNALGVLDDAAAAPFAGPQRQQILNKASKEFKRQAGSGTTRVPVAPRGGQPVNVNSPGRYTTLKDVPAGPLSNAQKLGIVSGATGVTGTGAVLATNGDQSIEDRLNQVGPAIDNFVGGLNFPGKQMLSDFGREQEKNGFGAMLNFGPGGLLGPVVAPFMPNSKVGSPRDFGENYAEQEAYYSQKAGLHQPPTPVTAPPVELPQQRLVTEEDSPAPPQVPDPSIGRTVTQQDVAPTVVDTSPKLPPSAEQTYMDPYAYQLQVYGQGRNAAQTQAGRDKVRDLGLAINRELFPKFDNQTSFNPLMADMFPDRYPQSLEAFIQERGVQAPGSMTEADATNEIAASEEEAAIYEMDEATADVEALIEELAARRAAG